MITALVGILMQAQVVIAPPVQVGLDYLYRNIQQQEFAVCLYGTVQVDGTYTQIKVENYKIAQIAYADRYKVQYFCWLQPDYLGAAHNHPSEQCMFSLIDRATFMRDTAAILDLLLCGESKSIWAVKLFAKGKWHD